jgi:5-oxopent-3-ene-1,2,5-tricarboxylate decarboxylase / 2-hydroxyhepta-2,4-diene-1,7-dioate isomerase
LSPDKFLPAGTVYGVLLNSQDEWDALAPQMNLPLHKAAPRAPVLFIKTANTWSESGSAIAVPARLAQVECSATVAMVIGSAARQVRPENALACVSSFVLMNDLSVPHASFFRPPVKFKNLDGFLGFGSRLAPRTEVCEPTKFRLELRINGELRQRVDFSRMRRDAAQLLVDISEFMTLHPGDVLMLGCGAGRPLARVGDRIEISAPGTPALGTLTNNLVAENERASA